MSRRIEFKGNYVEGEEVRINDTNERIARYELADGSVVSLQTTASAVYRVLGEYDDAGDPVYSVHYHTRMNLLSASPDLRRPEEEEEVTQ